MQLSWRRPPNVSTMSTFRSVHQLADEGFLDKGRDHLELVREPDVLRGFGLTVDDSPSPPRVYVRVRANREAVFRAATSADGAPVSDVLQIWLDVSTHPAQGREQADMIRKRVLKPVLS